MKADKKVPMGLSPKCCKIQDHAHIGEDILVFNNAFRVRSCDVENITKYEKELRVNRDFYQAFFSKNPRDIGNYVLVTNRFFQKHCQFADDVIMGRFDKVASAFKGMDRNLCLLHIYTLKFNGLLEIKNTKDGKDWLDFAIEHKNADLAFLIVKYLPKNYLDFQRLIKIFDASAFDKGLSKICHELLLGDFSDGSYDYIIESLIRRSSKLYYKEGFQLKLLIDLVNCLVDPNRQNSSKNAIIHDIIENTPADKEAHFMSLVSYLNVKEIDWSLKGRYEKTAIELIIQKSFETTLALVQERLPKPKPQMYYPSTRSLSSSGSYDYSCSDEEGCGLFKHIG